MLKANVVRPSVLVQSRAKDMIPSSNEIINLQACLDLITSCDINVKIKLISMISGYILLNDSNIDKIVTYNPLYDQICNILVNCSARKAAVTLNFVTALLFVREEDDDRKRTLVVYARNMIRSSGCLGTMCEMFASTMMNQDTWRALCRSIAEACRGVADNQSYCTHLVPMCIQKSSVRNTEMLIVLQSLLQKHSSNIELFLECNGMSLFQRELLQHDICLQLLATVVQTSKRAIELVSKINIDEQLRSYLNLYGPQSKLGQWATVILYHTTKVKETHPNKETHVKENIQVTNKLPPASFTNRDIDLSANTTKFFHNVMKEVIQFSSQNPPKHKAQALNKNNNLLNNDNVTQLMSFLNKTTRSVICDQRMNSCHTSYLKQNQQRESAINQQQISNLKMTNRNLILRKKTFGQSNITRQSQVSETVGPRIRKRPNQHRRPDLSFTFLQNEDLTRNENITSTSNYTTASNVTTVKPYHQNSGSSQTNKLDFSHFKPQFISTPKISKQKRNIKYNYTTNIKTKSTCEKSYLRNTTAFDQIEENKSVQVTKQRSIGGRFFDKINESCTTFVKTVKNIFGTKTQLDEVKKNSSKSFNNSLQVVNTSCSFTEYMRKRDGLLRRENTRSKAYCDFSKENSCNTCDDTVTLKRKLANDKYLKRTVRKLKLGINLYGCDFKKISKNMWPKDSYMTPVALYNLYRKLLIK